MPIDMKYDDQMVLVNSVVAAGAVIRTWLGLQNFVAIDAIGSTLGRPVGKWSHASLLDPDLADTHEVARQQRQVNALPVFAAAELGMTEEAIHFNDDGFVPL
jgi:hypothetical protein